jgi:hypothetical protein
MTPSSAASSEQYEALRRNALERGPIFSAEPLGAILVSKTGVAGWMREWKHVAEVGAAPSLPMPVARGPSEPGWQHELTMLLAQMSACHLRSRRPS